MRSRRSLPLALTAAVLSGALVASTTSALAAPDAGTGTGPTVGDRGLWPSAAGTGTADPIAPAPAEAGGVLPVEVDAAAPDLVVLDDTADAATVDALVDLVERTGGEVASRPGPGSSGFAARLTPRAERMLARHPAVADVADNTVFRTASRQQGAPWHLDRIDQLSANRDGAYLFGSAKQRSTGKGVTVYVVDSGVRATHRQLRGRVGKGFSVVGASPRRDCDGHGTHVAGLAAGKQVGVAKQARIVPVRVFGCNGRASADRIIRALDWVTKNHRKPAVMNLSLTGPRNRAVDNAVKRAIKRGVHVVAAAGNESINACRISPAHLPGVVTVGATARNDTLARFTNVGSCVDVYAPGVGLRSLAARNNTATRLESGTSMSAPVVAGTLARLLQHQKRLKPAGARKALVAAAPIQPTVRSATGEAVRVRALYAGLRDDLQRPGAPARQLLTNPGFEAGATGWQVAAPDDPQRASFTTTAPAAASGATKAQLGGRTDAGTTGIRQAVTVPTDAKRAWLAFRLRTLTAEKPTGDRDLLAVYVADAEDRLLDRPVYFSNRSVAGRYLRYEMNLRPFRGRQVFVTFVSVENGGPSTRFLLDDVYVGVS